MKSETTYAKLDKIEKRMIDLQKTEAKYKRVSDICEELIQEWQRHAFPSDKVHRLSTLIGTLDAEINIKGEIK